MHGWIFMFTSLTFFFLNDQNASQAKGYPMPLSEGLAGWVLCIDSVSAGDDAGKTMAPCASPLPSQTATAVPRLCFNKLLLICKTKDLSQRRPCSLSLKGGWGVGGEEGNMATTLIH